MFETYNQSNSTSLITLIPCHVYFPPSSTTLHPPFASRKSGKNDSGESFHSARSFQQLPTGGTASTLIQPTHGNITWNKNDKKNGFEKKNVETYSADIYCLWCRNKMFCDCLFTQDCSDQALQQTSWPWLPTLGSLPLIFSALMEISYLGAWW